jgi:hypothetical protein
MAELMPEDWTPSRTHRDGGTAGELVEARELARRNPGRWVVVGGPRPLMKPPTSWVSEVNRGEKKALLHAENLEYDATYEVTGRTGEDGRREYVKLIRCTVVSSETVTH